MARFYRPLLLCRWFPTRSSILLVFGVGVIVIFWMPWKLFLKTIVSSTVRQELPAENVNNIHNLQYSNLPDNQVRVVHGSDFQPNESSYNKPCPREIKVLILGFHLQSWSSTLSRTRDRYTKCPSLNVCVRTHYRPTRNDLFKYNVVLFSHLYMELRNFKSSSWFQLLKLRPPRQRWVMFSLEPPVRVGLNTSVPKRARTQSFHWTSTYDLHSDIPLPYGRYSKFKTPKKSELAFDGRELLSSKTGLVAFLSSNCDKTRWPRTKFVEAFQKVLNIDTFGKCGTRTCEPICEDVLKRYKFVLALENAPCRGYITEKFWNALEVIRAVPIVFGPFREDYEAIAPPNSFIHVHDFQSMTSLAEYITGLHERDSDYLAYHSWRNNGTLTSIVHDWSILPFDETFCDIADRYETDMKSMDNNNQAVTFRDVNGGDWLDTCQVHAIRPRGTIDHLPIPIN